MKIIEDRYPYYKVVQKIGNVNNVIAIYNVESVADAVVKILIKSHPNDVNDVRNIKYLVIPSNSLL